MSTLVLQFKEAEDGVSRANQDKSDLKLARETHQREVAALQEQQANADQRLHALRSQAAELERQQEKARNACATKEGELQEYQVGAAKAREVRSGSARPPLRRSFCIPDLARLWLARMPCPSWRACVRA